MIVQAFDPDPARITLNQTGAFDTQDLYACRHIVPYGHRLYRAWLCSMNCVIEGTIEVTLRFTDPGMSRAGSQIGLKLENDDLDPVAGNTFQKWGFDLQGYPDEVSPAFRQYLIGATATDHADRLDELTLMLDVRQM